MSWRVTDCPAVKCRSAARLGDGQLVFHLLGRIDAGSDVKALGNTAATAWFGLSALPHRGDFAHDGWAIDVLEAQARPREEAIRIRSVVE